jgi:nucleotide-binding universal stress UspA family protein
MYKRVLIPLDGSALAEQALPHAIAQATHFQAELILLKVVEPFPHARGMSLADLEQISQQSRIWADEYLERLATGIQQQGVSVQKVIIEGRPPAGIAEYAETNQVDLIVMSTRGQSGLSRWLMGSVADRVVRGATIPVLLVRAEQKQEPGNRGQHSLHGNHDPGRGELGRVHASRRCTFQTKLGV